MTTSSLSESPSHTPQEAQVSIPDDETIFSYEVKKSGITSVTIGDVSKVVSFENGVSLLKVCVPEMASNLVQEAVVSKSMTFPRYLVKTVIRDSDSDMFAVLYAPATRQTYRQKFKYSSETNLESYVQFFTKLAEIVGLERILGILTERGISLSDDNTIWTCKNYLFPNICTVVRLSPSNVPGTYTYKENYYRATSSSRDEIAPVMFSPRDDVKSHRMPFPNFFDSDCMCFGSIDRKSIFNFGAEGYSSLDFFINVVYRSFFNTDLDSVSPIVPDRLTTFEEFCSLMKSVFTKADGTKLDLSPATAHLRNERGIYRVITRIFFYTSSAAEYLK